MRDFKKLLNEIAKENDWDITSPGLVVRAHRHRFALTLKELAEVTGIRETNLSSIENGRIEMSPHYAEILGTAFGVSPATLLYPNGSPKKTRELEAVAKRMRKYVKRAFGPSARTKTKRAGNA